MVDPLARYRVLHLTTNVPGPVAASKLARAGARVVKVEPPGGDSLEAVAPGWYESIHQGQTVLRLDLKTPEGLGKMEELLAESDLFLTTTRPQGLERLKLDWKSVHARHPALSMVRIQGYPAPRENVAAHDLCCQARAGLLAPPALPRALVSDFAAAERAYSASLLLLLAMQERREGACTVVTLQDSAEEFAAAFRAGLTGGRGALGGAVPAYGLYEAKGGWIAFAALEPHFLERFRSKLALGEVSAESLTRVFRGRTAREWEEFGDANDIPLAAVADLEGSSGH